MIFILGASPSLLNFDLSILSDKVTLAINTVYQALSFTPSYMFWQDKNFIKYNNISYINSIKYCSDQSLFKPLTFKTHKFFNLTTVKPHWNNHLPVLSGILSSGAKATQLAYTLGYTEITILGIDGKITPDKNEWYGNNKFWKEHTLHKIRKDLNFIRTFPGKLNQPQNQQELEQLC